VRLECAHSPSPIDSLLSIRILQPMTMPLRHGIFCETKAFPLGELLSVETAPAPGLQWH
jgi:hypothetical protein